MPRFIVKIIAGDGHVVYLSKLDTSQWCLTTDNIDNACRMSEDVAVRWEHWLNKNNTCWVAEVAEVAKMDK